MKVLNNILITGGILPMLEERPSYLLEQIVFNQSLTIKQFGASAPANKLLEEYGLLLKML